MLFWRHLLSLSRQMARKRIALIMTIKEMFVRTQLEMVQVLLFNYDHANKIKDVVVGTSNSILLSERYEYDQAGNCTKIKHEGTGGKVTETNFVYDPINQLLNEALPNGTTKLYTYDGFGNRTRVKVVENGKETKSIEATF